MEADVRLKRLICARGAQLSRVRPHSHFVPLHHHRAADHLVISVTSRVFRSTFHVTAKRNIRQILCARDKSS